ADIIDQSLQYPIGSPPPPLSKIAGLVTNLAIKHDTFRQDEKLAIEMTRIQDGVWQLSAPPDDVKDGHTAREGGAPMRYSGDNTDRGQGSYGRPSMRIRTKEMNPGDSRWNNARAIFSGPKRDLGDGPVGKAYSQLYDEFHKLKNKDGHVLDSNGN